MRWIKTKSVFILAVFIGFTVLTPVPGFAAGSGKTKESCAVAEGQEIEGENPIYDSLEKRIRNEWDKGLESIEEVGTIEITGNPVERLLRVITAALYRSLKSIKAGALLIGASSFCIGIIVAVSARKNKKARRFAVVALITVIPVSLFIMTFCLAMLVSIFS